MTHSAAAPRAASFLSLMAGFVLAAGTARPPKRCIR